MERIHITNNKKLEKELFSCANVKKSLKPLGLWYGIDKSWEQWAYDNMNMTKDCKYSLIIDENSILKMQYSHELHNFTDEFGEYNRCGVMDINWEDVAQKYKGIEIAPYIWSCRMELFWYHGWDCASGCIWDVSAIKEIKKVKTAKAA